MERGLYIPKRILIIASGISEKVINDDIVNKVLRTDEMGMIWYRDALVYVDKKWSEGKVKMYPPYSNESDNSFSARVLSIIDDEIVASKVKVTWSNKP